MVMTIPAWVQDLITLSLSVMIEATPFVVLGVLLSVAISKLVPERWFMKWVPKHPFLRRGYLSLFGLFLPVCECGNLPLSRGLIVKGLKPSDALTFLFSAPLLNPITITTTIIAFGYDKRIVLARIIGGVVIANIVGWALSSKNESSYLTKSFTAHCEIEYKATKDSKVRQLFTGFTEELKEMMPALLLGSVIAGAVQVVIPRDMLTVLGSHLVVSVVVMLILAFVVSICANVDAFFALSFAGTFTAGSIVTFLVFGPMIDIKMLSLMRTTFSTTAILRASLLVGLLSVLLGLGVNYAL
jgi:uncharacterized protein